MIVDMRDNDLIAITVLTYEVIFVSRRDRRVGGNVMYARRCATEGEDP